MRKLAVLALLACTTAYADSVQIGIGQMQNNTRRNGFDGMLLDVAARKAEAIGSWDAQASFTYVQHSDFGGRDGGEQIVTAGLLRPYQVRGSVLRVGGGLLVAVHFPVPENDAGGHPGILVAQCLMCGYFAQASIQWKRLELSYRYIATDPNSYPAHNGGMLLLSLEL